MLELKSFDELLNKCRKVAERERERESCVLKLLLAIFRDSIEKYISVGQC